MLLFIELDTRDLTEGEKPYSSFYVLALPPEKNGPPEILPFYRIDPACIEWDCNVRPINTSQYSFLLPHPEGKLHAQAWDLRKHIYTEFIGLDEITIRATFSLN